MFKKTTKQEKPQQQQIRIEIAELRRVAFELILFGETPLIMNAWTQKAKLEMLKKHMQVPNVRAPKDPQEQFLNSMYRFEDGAFGFPVVGVKEAMATATTDMEGISKASIYRNLFCKGRQGFQVGAFCDILSPIELAELFSPNPPAMREDVVKLAGPGRTPDLRYRAEFFPWALRLQVSYIPDFIRDTDLFNLAAKAGFVVGLGEWRQERGGSSGLFRVATEQDKKQVAKWIAAGHKEPKLIDVAGWRAGLEAASRDAREKAALEKLAVKAPRGRKRGNGAAREVVS